MEKLPKFLDKSIANACESFTNMTYTVHADDKKAKISIMFAQNDNKQTMRRSKSTARRDNRRTDKREVKLNKNTSNNMELAEGLTDNSVDETINITNETLDKTDNKTETKTENQNIDGKKQRNEDQASVNSKMVMSKVVLKHSKHSPDTLIGKVTGSNKLVLYNLKTNHMFQVPRTHAYYNTCLRSVDNDLSDVRENPFRPPYIDDIIEGMLKYTLYNDFSGF